MIRRSLVAAIVLALAFPAHAQGLPDLGDVSSAALSESQERTIGNRIMREVRVDPSYVDDPEVADYMAEMGARLLGVSEGVRRDLSFFAIQDETPNAFALVGGHIGVNTGLILLTQNESELAGVVAHEIAHISQKHQARMVHGQSRAAWTSLAALAIAVLASRGGGSSSGQMSEAAMATAGALNIQNQLDYTREHEREADRVGLTLLEKAGFDPGGMGTFFERMLRANRLNEFKAPPGYLRTHPLTTERIADMQDRLDRYSQRLVPDSFEYRLVRAKLRAATGSAAQAVNYFRVMLEDKTVVRPREDVYGLALALRRAREFDAAWKTLQPLREGSTHPAFELLAAQIRAEEGRYDEALAIYRAASRAYPRYRSIAHGHIQLLLNNGKAAEALEELKRRLPAMGSDDARLYELKAQAHAALGQRLQQHRSQAEAHVRRGNLGGAVEQLELAVKVRGSDFYELSSAESRLRELRSQHEAERAAEKALKIS